MQTDNGIDTLIELNGNIVQQERGYWVEIHAWYVVPTILIPHGIRYAMSQVIAALVYWPLARSAKLAEYLGMNVVNFPLAPYRNWGFYVMRTDALDRFGTRLEQRFTGGKSRR